MFSIKAYFLGGQRTSFLFKISLSKSVRVPPSLFWQTPVSTPFIVYYIYFVSIVYIWWVTRVSFHVSPESRSREVSVNYYEFTNTYNPHLLGPHRLFYSGQLHICTCLLCEVPCVINGMLNMRFTCPCVYVFCLIYFW